MTLPHPTGANVATTSRRHPTTLTHSTGANMSTTANRYRATLPQPADAADPDRRSATAPFRRVLGATLLLILVATGCSDSSENADDIDPADIAETTPDETSETEDADSDADNADSGADPSDGSSETTAGGPSDGSDPSETMACDDEPEVRTTDAGVDFVRTPDACFEGLVDWPYEPNYVEIDGLRQAYADVGPADGDVVLLLHGQPSWSYLYRDMIAVLSEAGHRVIAMDHLGMGRSDKPVELDAYSYLGHNERLETFIVELGLTDINLFVQDWGSLIGLRVAGLNPELYATIAIGDGTLPVVPEGFEPFPVEIADPDVPADLASPFEAVPAQQPPFYDGCELIGEREGGGDFGTWIRYSMTAESFRPSEVLEAMTWFDLTDEVEAAYDAPFPSRIYMGGPRSFPSLVNELGGQNAEAWDGLVAFDKPVLTLWAANDPGNLGQCATQENLVSSIAGARNQPHARLDQASHFLQDDQGTEIANRLVDWYANPGDPNA